MVVQHFLGKEKVSGSNPGVGSTTLLRRDFVFVSRLLEGGSMQPAAVAQREVILPSPPAKHRMAPWTPAG
jgi:hypothetical protein